MLRMIANGLLATGRRCWLLVGLLYLGLASAHAADNFLEVDQAFKFSAAVLDDRTVEVRFDIAPGYYMYRERLSTEAQGATVGAIELPKGKVKFDETFQKQVETWRDRLVYRVPIEQASAQFDLMVSSQGCADAGLCYPPMLSQAQVSLKGFGGAGTAVLPAGRPDRGSLLASAASAAPSVSVQAAAPAVPPVGTDLSAIEALLKSGSYLTVMGGFLVLGLMLSFTPCVFPMMPILSSIIAGGGEVSRQRGLALAFAYSFGMAMVYTALGVAAGLAGKGLAAALQTPWVLICFALLLGVLSLSMFDVFELRLPLALSGRLEGASRSLPGGRFAGVFLMGALSALIVSPCVTAPLATALLFLSQTGDVWLAGSALFAMAWGMSVPLLLLGASSGHWLPRSGAWMHAVKRFFGLLLLAVAWWIVQPVLPGSWPLVGWGGLLLVSGFMMRPFDAHPHSHAPRVWMQRAVGLAALAFGVMQLTGAASGGHDALQPLRHLAGTSRASAAIPELRFQAVRSIEELEAALTRADRPVMLDFYADWCVSCKEMERFTFSDASIQKRLNSAILLKADVTANNGQDQALLKRFHLFGPPGTIFFDATGKELPGVRVMGFQSVADFQKTLTAAGL